MRERKRCIPQFAFYDKEGIQAYLEKQAQAGWMLEEISFGWLFRRTAPKRMHFFVAYYPKKSVFEGDGSEEQKLFWELCDHAGSLAGQFRRDPVDVLGNNALLCMMPAMAFLGAYVIREILRYFLWHRRAKKMAEEEGVFAGTKGIGKVWSMLLFLAMAFILLEMFFLSDGGIARVILGLAVMLAGMTALTVGISRTMRKRGVPAGINRITVILLTAAGCIAVTAGIFMQILRGGISSGKEPVRTVTYGGWTYEVYRDALPLTLEDLTVELDVALELTEKQMDVAGRKLAQP